jgi:hypothetical protein
VYTGLALIRIAPSSTRTALSPPTPMETVARERISVLWSPILMPIGSSSGAPLTNTAMSVVRAVDIQSDDHDDHIPIEIWFQQTGKEAF